MLAQATRGRIAPMTSPNFEDAEREMKRVEEREKAERITQIVTIEHVGYPPSNSWSDTMHYDLTKLFCPGCGARTVWVEWGDGDYYQGREHICASCALICFLDGCESPSRLQNDPAVAEQLRTRTQAPPKYRMAP